MLNCYGRWMTRPLARSGTELGAFQGAGTHFVKDGPSIETSNQDKRSPECRRLATTHAKNTPPGHWHISWNPWSKRNSFGTEFRSSTKSLLMPQIASWGSKAIEYDPAQESPAAASHRPQDPGCAAMTAVRGKDNATPWRPRAAMTRHSCAAL